jgi:hypothetical protein
MLPADIAPEAVLTDKTYDADELLLCSESKGAKAVILPKANRKVESAARFRPSSISQYH